MLQAVHLAAAWVMVALVGLVLAGALIGAPREAGPPRGYRRLRSILLLGLGCQAVIGAVLLLTGQRPGTGIHVMYGLVGLAILPLSGELGRRAGRPAIYEVVGATLLAGVIFRLFATGG